MKKLIFLSVMLIFASCLRAATETVTFEVKGWTCGSCAAATRIALKKLEGVEDVKTDMANRKATVTYDDTKVAPNKMISAIESLGYKATVTTAASPAAGRANADTNPAQDAARPFERVSFFEVPLECGAVDGLGCGSASKPVLKALERNSEVREAKVNYAGTTLAVVWSDPEKAHEGVVESAFKTRDLDASILRDQARDKALREYGSGRWYGAADVDRLSEREAHVIATRLINRARLDLAPDKMAAFNKDLSTGIAAILTRDKDEECARNPFEELSKVASRYLDDRQMAKLKMAADRGARALPGEER